mgnify:CR=1 FL=1
METNPARGHLAALLTIVIWGTTFISTKVLLVDFQPVEILFIRFMMGFLALLAVCPRRLKNRASHGGRRDCLPWRGCAACACTTCWRTSP